jgi:hypothetical protein
MMRHPEREMKDNETIEAILKQSQVGRMATINQNGYPVIKPVNFLYRDGRVYVHSSLKGEKAEDIRRGPLVCFEVDVPIAFVAAQGTACKANFYYRSVILKGKAALLDDRGKKLEVLQRLMEKYQPEGGFTEIQEEVLARTAIIEISPDEITGKENLG